MREKDNVSGEHPVSAVPPMQPEPVSEPECGVDKGLAHFYIGQAVQHRKFGFKGVIFDVDPVFANTDEWYEAIPAEVRPRKDQPFYHLFAVNPADNSPYIAYVSQQNLIPMPDDEDVVHPQLEEYFEGYRDGAWRIATDRIN